MNSSYSNKGSQKTPSQLVTSALNTTLTFHKLQNQYAVNIAVSICISKLAKGSKGIQSVTKRMHKICYDTKLQI